MIWIDECSTNTLTICGVREIVRSAGSVGGFDGDYFRNCSDRCYIEGCGGEKRLCKCRGFKEGCEESGIDLRCEGHGCDDSGCREY